MSYSLRQQRFGIRVAANSQPAVYLCRKSLFEEKLIPYELGSSARTMETNERVHQRKVG